jgi:RND family efflux transporter MFP subunit
MKIINRPVFFLFATLSSIAVHAADFDATVDFASRFELSLPVSGLVQTVKVAAGQAVPQGDEMLALDPVPFKAARAHAQSRVNLRQTILSESLRDLKQQQELYDRTVLATVELENAQLREKRDRASLEEAQAELVDADYELANSRLIAPFDALVLSVETNPGQSISNVLQSKTLITLVKQGLYHASFYVPGEALEKFTIGQSVTVNIESKAYPGEISNIDYEPVQASGDNAGLFMLQASFTAVDKAMFIGRKAKVHID